jgi:hypothetical protein
MATSFSNVAPYDVPIESDNLLNGPPSADSGVSRPTSKPKTRACGICGIAGHTNSIKNPCEGKAKKGARPKQVATIDAYLAMYPNHDQPRGCKFKLMTLLNLEAYG